jgi:hypothetical protein
LLRAVLKPKEKASTSPAPKRKESPVLKAQSNTSEVMPIAEPEPTPEQAARDAYLSKLITLVNTDLIVSGIGEQPAIIHLRDFGITGFTAGCVCIKPQLSTDMLHAIQAKDYAKAEEIRQIFLPLEDQRNAHSPILVLHHAVIYTGNMTAWQKWGRERFSGHRNATRIWREFCGKSLPSPFYFNHLRAVSGTTSAVAAGHRWRRRPPRPRAPRRFQAVKKSAVVRAWRRSSGACGCLFREDYTAVYITRQLLAGKRKGECHLSGQDQDCERKDEWCAATEDCSEGINELRPVNDV